MQKARAHELEPKWLRTAKGTCKRNFDYKYHQVPGDHGQVRQGPRTMAAAGSGNAFPNTSKFRCYQHPQQLWSVDPGLAHGVQVPAGQVLHTRSVIADAFVIVRKKEIASTWYVARARLRSRVYTMLPICSWIVFHRQNHQPSDVGVKICLSAK